MAHRCGFYRAVVANTADPLGHGRIKLICHQLWGQNETDWVWPCVAPGPGPLPAVGSQVWTGFEGGDEDYPIWFGTPDGSNLL